jgi:hypothetical protein
MAPYGESSRRLRRLCDEPVSPLQLVTRIMYDEEEVPNTKRMHVVEEEVLLSQPETTAVPPKEEEVPVPQGPVVMVLPEEEVPLEEVEIPAHAVTVPQGPPVTVPLEE